MEPVYRRELSGRIVMTIGLGLSGTCIIGVIVLLVHSRAHCLAVGGVWASPWRWSNQSTPT